MKTLPLFYYPSTWVWVDDDKTLLSTMTYIFGKYNSIVSFPDPNLCLDYLKSYQAPSTKYSFLRNNTNDEDYGVMQRTPLNFDISLISKLLNDANRHSEITSMVIDYNMPELNGFELAKLTQNLSIPRILLTGNREDNKAIEGFNDGLINRFIQKAEPEMVNKLLEYLVILTQEYFQKLSRPLLSYLETEGKIALSDPTYIDFFETYCSEHDIKEFYLIDKIGSFLCVDKNGIKSCLVVHTDKSLAAWLEVYGDDKNLNENDLLDLQKHKKIPFFGIDKEACHFDSQDWHKHFYLAEPIEGREKYFWSKIKII